MTENTKLIEALETISKETDVPVKEIIELLTGFCWDEEEAYELVLVYNELRKLFDSGIR